MKGARRQVGGAMELERRTEGGAATDSGWSGRSPRVEGSVTAVSAERERAAVPPGV